MTGPSNPQITIGEPEVISRFVTRQGYEDGCIYQIAVRRGSSFEVLGIAAQAIPDADRKRMEISNTINPWDVNDFNDENLYFSYWVQGKN